MRPFSAELRLENKSPSCPTNFGIKELNVHLIYEVCIRLKQIAILVCWTWNWISSQKKSEVIYPSTNVGGPLVGINNQGILCRLYSTKVKVSSFSPRSPGMPYVWSKPSFRVLRVWKRTVPARHTGTGDVCWPHKVSKNRWASIIFPLHRYKFECHQTSSAHKFHKSSGDAGVDM